MKGVSMSVNKRLANGTLMPIAGLGTYDINDLKQYTTLPTASSANEGSVVQYVGTNSTDYVIGGIYQCQLNESDDSYDWVLLTQEIDVDDAISSTSENPVQNKVIKAALDDKADTSAITNMQEQFYQTTEPTATKVGAVWIG